MSRLEPLRGFLDDWLQGAAYPLWSQHGIQANGSFVEALDRNGWALALPRRARVHPRQVYAFAQGHALGWHENVTDIVERGMRYFSEHYRRDDGLFVTLLDCAGRIADDRVLLYDQAFALLGYAAAADALDALTDYEARAVKLRQQIETQLGADEAAFRSEAGVQGYASNPHMHLLEAYLAWAEIGLDAGWIDGVRSLANLALTRFVQPDTGAIWEHYAADWRAVPGLNGHSIEPGHQFEWAWLLLRCERWLEKGEVRDTALKLIALAEGHGLREGVVVNALRDDLTVAESSARLWPQCERLKAGALAVVFTNEERYWTMTQAAAASVCRYLETSVRGLWFDSRCASGELNGDVVPASTFYHLVGAISVLHHCARATS